MIMGLHRSHVDPWLGSFMLISLLSFFACHVASENSNYFSFPLLAASIPTVHNGDTVNVTWKSHTTQATLNHWCNQVLLEEIDGLSGDGHHVFAVNTTWTSPCHFQYVNAADVSDYIDSGALDVTNQKATPAVTWVPSAVGTACGMQTVTSTLMSAAGQKATTTTIHAVVTAAAANGTTTTQTRHALSGGAGIGIGFAAGVAAGALATAAVWAVLRRQHAKRQRRQQLVRLDDGPPVDVGKGGVAFGRFELTDMAAPTELDPSRRPPAEMSSTPRLRQHQGHGSGNFI